jgi:TetR/AcrR family transcriptional regulator, transcriptional repressor for nem operon
LPQHYSDSNAHRDLGNFSLFLALCWEKVVSIYREIDTFLCILKSDVRTQLLDTAQRLVQTRGHNGFSFRDLSRHVGIRTASVHYHFPTKADLAVALVRRYREGVGEAMADIAVQRESLAERLDATVRLYTGTLSNQGRVCVCAALAGEYLSLSRPVQAELRKLITDGERWIDRFLTEGRVRGEIPADSDPQALARLWYAALQGALLVSRAAGPEILNDAAAALKKMTLTSK